MDHISHLECIPQEPVFSWEHDNKYQPLDSGGPVFQTNPQYSLYDTFHFGQQFFFTVALWISCKCFWGKITLDTFGNGGAAKWDPPFHPYKGPRSSRIGLSRGLQIGLCGTN